MVEVVDELNLVVCFRCGVKWVVSPAKRGRRDLLCVSCRMKPVKSIQYGVERCVPWHGDFTENDEPLLNGVLFMVGERSCLHRDCVNPMHIVGWHD